MSLQRSYLISRKVNGLLDNLLNKPDMNNHPYCHVACPYASGGVLGGDDVTIKYKGLVWECYDGWNPFCTKDCKALI